MNLGQASISGSALTSVDEAFENGLEVRVVQLSLPFRVQQIEATIEVDTDDDYRRVGAKPFLRSLSGSPRRVLQEVEARAEPFEVLFAGANLTDEQVRYCLPGCAMETDRIGWRFHQRSSGTVSNGVHIMADASSHA